MATPTTPDQTLAAVRAECNKWRLLAAECSAILEALRASEGDGTSLCDTIKAAIVEATDKVRAALPPEPGKLPMVLGRHPKIGIEQSTGMYVVSYSHDVLDSSGRWVHWSRKTNADKHPTREAAEKFVRDCAVKEQAAKCRYCGTFLIDGKCPANGVHNDFPPVAKSVARSLPNAVKQTTPTNCFAACVASILGVPIDSVPGVDGANWDWDKFEDWLAAQGWQAVEMTFGNGGTIYPVRAPVPCVISGRSPRGDKLHAVCGELIGVDGFRLTHDPHPSDLWIDGEPVHATFFVPLDLRRHWRSNGGGEMLGVSTPSQPATDSPPPADLISPALSESFVRENINPIVGYLVNSARGAAMLGLPDSNDWEYLREGTRRIKTLLEGETAKLRAEVERLTRERDTAADFCRTNMNPSVNVGRQAMAGEVLRILEGK